MSSATRGTVVVAAAGWHDEAPGGANKLPTDVARFLARRGWDVAYICAGLDRRPIAAERVDGVQLWRYPKPIAASPSVANLRAHTTWSRRIVQSIAQHRAPHAILGHAPLQYLGAVVGAGRGIRKCYGVHSPFVEELKANHVGWASVKQRLAWRVAGLIEARIYTRSDVIHCDSAYSLAMIRKQYPRPVGDKGIVLPGWVDSTHFTPARETARAIRARLGAPWDAGAPTFFTLRRLVPRMGLDMLIDAAGILASEGREFRVVIGGSGPERDALEARARMRGLATHVAFLGRVADAELVDAFRAADCFVLPTRTLECFGLIILESLACGVPVIATPVGSIPEVMGEELQAWVALEASAPALAAKMRAVMDGDLRADRSALRARALAFDVQRVIAEHEQTLLDAVPRRAASERLTAAIGDR